MKYTLENLHFNHIWSSAFQKWFCLTTSDLSFRKVPFRRMPAFKSQVNQTQTNFPGGCNEPDKCLMLSFWPLRCTRCICPAIYKSLRCCMLYNASPIHNRVSWAFIKICIITVCCLLGQPWLRLSTWLDTSLQRLILCPSQFALPKAPGHSGLRRIIVPCFILEIAIWWCNLKLSFAYMLKLMH